MPPEILDAVARIEAQTFVRAVDWFAEIGSTNDYALSIANDPDIVTPRLIWADRQYAGRGRSGHAWWSAAGALTCSLLVDRQTWSLSPVRWPEVALVTGLAIAEAIAEFVPKQPVQVKWPNDVYLAGRKVCGILMESASADLQHSVIGIGINVGNSFAAAPQELQATATAMCDHAAVPPRPVEVLLRVLECWQTWMVRVFTQRVHLPSAWESRCLLTHRQVRITAGSASIEGVCHGIDTDGALLIETATGTKRCVTGTVRLLSAL